MFMDTRKASRDSTANRVLECELPDRRRGTVHPGGVRGTFFQLSRAISRSDPFLFNSLYHSTNYCEKLKKKKQIYIICVARVYLDAAENSGFGRFNRRNRVN